MHEPVVTKEQMVRTLREVAPQANRILRVAMLEVADRIEAGRPMRQSTLKRMGPLGSAVQAIIEREPGEEG